MRIGARNVRAQLRAAYLQGIDMVRNHNLSLVVVVVVVVVVAAAAVLFPPLSFISSNLLVGVLMVTADSLNERWVG